jgi:basic amino acid/polyamine antiporter, APA family
MPGGSITAYIAAIGSILILLAMLLPVSPAALSWPIDWLILFSFITLALLFWFLSAGYRNSISEKQRSSLILEEFTD